MSKNIKILNAAEHIRFRPKMYIRRRMTFSSNSDFCDWRTLFYDVLHAFAMMKGDDGVINVSYRDGGFCFTTNRQIYLNTTYEAYDLSITVVQALSELFYINQQRNASEVRFKPDANFWHDMVYDERAVEDIIKDYAYLHPNQTVIWKKREFHYPDGLKDMLRNESGIVNEILWLRGCFMDWDVEIALAKTGTGASKVIGFVNTRRVSGGLLASALQKAIKEQLPEIAEKGYVVAIDISATGDELFFEDANPTKVGYISEALNYRVTKAVEKLSSLSDKAKNNDSLVTLMEENPTVFYDTSELEDLDGSGVKDGVTQQTIQEWGTWIEEQKKKDKE